MTGGFGLSLTVEQANAQETQERALGLRVELDSDAFALLYERYLCRIFAFIRAQVTDESVAEDLTAQVFFRALRSAHTYDGTGTYSAWLYAIARNCVVNWYRERGRDVVLPEIPDTTDPDPGPMTRVIDEESRASVLQAVSTLPRRQREAILLRYIEELPIEQIARKTGRTPGAVRILLHRARNRLRKIYERKAL